MQEEDPLFRQEELIIAQLKSVKLVRIGLHIAHKAKRHADLGIGDRRGETRLAQQAIPAQQVVFTAVDNALLPNWSIIDSTGTGVMPRRSLRRRIARRGPDVMTRKPTTNTTASVASIIQTMNSP